MAKSPSQLYLQPQHALAAHWKTRLAWHITGEI